MLVSTRKNEISSLSLPSKHVWGDLWKFPVMVPSGKNSFRRPRCQHRRPYIFCHFEKTFIPCRKKISTQLHLATFLVGYNFINKIWQRIPLVPYKTLARAETSCIFGGWQNDCNFLFQRSFWRFWNVKEREIARVWAWPWQYVTKDTKCHWTVITKCQKKNFISVVPWCFGSSPVRVAFSNLFI